MTTPRENHTRPEKRRRHLQGKSLQPVRRFLPPPQLLRARTRTISLLLDRKPVRLRPLRSGQKPRAPRAPLPKRLSAPRPNPSVKSLMPPIPSRATTRGPPFCRRSPQGTFQGSPRFGRSWTCSRGRITYTRDIVVACQGSVWANHRGIWKESLGPTRRITSTSQKYRASLSHHKNTISNCLLARSFLASIYNSVLTLLFPPFL